MYSPKVIESSISRYEEKASHKLVRIEASKTQDWVNHLASLWDKEEKKWKRDLTKEEKLFVRNERVMCAIDFRYWLKYATIQRDGGGICTATHLWESQEIFLRVISKLEEDMYEAMARGEPVEGILICLHKARQLGATALARLLAMHRETTSMHLRGMSASVDDDKIMELYDRDKLIIENLPIWLCPEVGYDEKAAHIYFEKLNSRMLYQVATQKSGLGTGRQFDIGHLTECSSWPNPLMIEFDFFPTIPQSYKVLVILESTANGRGDWWHDFTGRVRQGDSRRWRYVFVPWYAELSKYRATPSVNWNPSKVSMLHAQNCYDTSPEFVGKNVMLSREQLWWWESTREEYLKAGRLNFFLTNYCATPEESFQHSGQSAFDPLLIESLRMNAKPGYAYEISRNGGQA